MLLGATLCRFLLKPELYYTAHKMRIQVPTGSQSKWLTAEWRAAWVRADSCREQSIKKASAMGGESILSGHCVCVGLIKAVERMTGIRLSLHTNSNMSTCAAASTKTQTWTCKRNQNDKDKIDFSYCFKGWEINWGVLRCIILLNVKMTEIPVFQWNVKRIIPLSW